MTGFRHNGGPTLNHVSGPKCLSCGSTNMITGGFTSFHWRRGRWVEQRGAAEMSDGCQIHCQACGDSFIGNLEPPFDLKRECSL